MLSGEAFATKTSSEEHVNQNKYIPEDSENSYSNEINNVADANSSKYSKANSSESGDDKNSESSSEMLQNKLSLNNENKISDYRQDRDKLKDKLQLQRKQYQQAKKDFLKTRDQINTGKINPQSNEALNATKFYLNSSINYMVAHLSNVKSNVEYSNVNGTEETIGVINERIKLLEEEKTKVENASNQKELADIVRSVRGIWEDAQEISLTSTGQIVSGKIGEYLEKSELLSGKLEERIKSLNETGTDTS